MNRWTRIKMDGGLQIFIWLTAVLFILGAIIAPAPNTIFVAICTIIIVAVLVGNEII